MTNKTEKEPKKRYCIRIVTSDKAFFDQIDKLAKANIRSLSRQGEFMLRRDLTNFEKNKKS